MQLAALQPQPLLPRPRGDAGQRGPAALPGRARQGAAGNDLRTARPSASSAWRSRPTATTRATRSSLQAAARLARAASAARCSAPTRTCRDPGLVPLDERRSRAPDVLFVGDAAPRRTAIARAPAEDKTVVDVWSVHRRTTAVNGRASHEDPGHRRGRVHRRLPRRRSCSTPATRSSASTTSRSTARSRRATTATRATASSRATPRTSALLKRAARRLRPLRRRRGDDRRHLLLPRATPTT